MNTRGPQCLDVWLLADGLVHVACQNAAEVVATFKELKKAGKVRWFGVSNFSPSQVELLRAAFEKEGLVLGAAGGGGLRSSLHNAPRHATAHHGASKSLIPSPCVCAELEISALTPTALYDGRLNQLQRVGMSPLGWGPLGGDPMGGVNRLFNFDGDRQLRIRKALKGVAQELGPGESRAAWGCGARGFILYVFLFFGAYVHECSRVSCGCLADVTEDQVAIAWLLKHPANIIPVLGTTKVERINAQAKAVSGYPAISLSSPLASWLDVKVCRWAWS
jgi:predicted oxidoreductase